MTTKNMLTNMTMEKLHQENLGVTLPSYGWKQAVMMTAKLQLTMDAILA